jgi:hypothetical protein
MSLLASSCGGSTGVSNLAASTKFLIGACDIAQCALDVGDPILSARKTAELVETLLPRFGDKAQIFTLGDNIYNTGTLAEYTKRYQPTWGPISMLTVPLT